MKKLGLIAALLTPIIMLAFVIGRNEMILSNTIKHELPIRGYDPLHLLAGHYLRYKVDYGIDPCAGKARNKRTSVKVCLTTPGVIVSEEDAKLCNAYIKGICQYGRYRAGIERFYIPDQYAKKLDEQVRKGQIKLVIRVTPDGKARAVNLLINGKSFLNK